MNIVAGALAGNGPGAGWRLGPDEAAANHCVAYGGNNTRGPISVSTALTAHGGGSGRMDFESETFVAPAVAFGWQNAAAQGMPVDTIAPTLDKSKHPATATATAVRRLMPVECERLQGFPDGHTAITWRGKPAADGPRYKVLGNSWAVNCARWLGRRIEAVDSIKHHNLSLSANQSDNPITDVKDRK